MAEANIYEGKLYDGIASGNSQVSVIHYVDRLVIHKLTNTGTNQTQSWSLLSIKDFEILNPDLVKIYYGENPVQTLEVESREFSQKFKPPVSSSAKFIHKVFHNGIGVLAIFTAFIIGLLLALYFFALPFLAEKSVSLFPKEYEIKMGEALYENMIKTESVNKQKTDIANQFLKQINFESDYPIKVTIVNSEIKNAFALPGGHIVVYSKLLNDMKGYGELVALLGHEAGHVKHRHTTRHIFRSMSGYLVISVLFGDLSGISALIVENTNQLNQLSYSRSLETEADEAGYETMVKNGVDPKGIMDLFENLKKGNESTNVVPEFLSTHPITENRMKNIKEKINKDTPVHSENIFLQSLFQQLKKGNKADY